MTKFDKIITAKLLEAELHKIDIPVIICEDYNILHEYINKLYLNEPIEESLKAKAIGAMAALGIGGSAIAYGATKNDVVDAKNTNHIQTMKHNVDSTAKLAKTVNAQDTKQNINNNVEVKPTTKSEIKIKTYKDFPQSPAICGSSVTNIINLINSQSSLKNIVYKNGIWDSRITPEVIVTLVCEVGTEYNGTPERVNVFKVIKARIQNKGFKQGKLNSTRDVVLHNEGSVKAFSFWSDLDNHNFSIFNNYEKLKTEFEKNKNFANSIIDAIKIQSRDYEVGLNSPVFYETHKSANTWTKKHGKGNRFTSKYYISTPVDVGTSPHIFYKMQPVKKAKK